MALGMFGRSIAGGIAGGLMTGDLGGIAGGAAMAGLGGWAGGKMLANRGNTSGLLKKGLGLGIKGSVLGSELGARTFYKGGAANKALGGALFRSSNTVGAGLIGARSWTMKHSNGVNAVGSVAFGALGTAAGAHIGSSVLASNRGY